MARRKRRRDPRFRVESYRLPGERDDSAPSAPIRLTVSEWNRVATAASVLYHGAEGGLPILYSWEVDDIRTRQLFRRGNRLYLVERL